MHKVDITIIGAGVVGCAIARELALRFPEKRIVVLEKLAGAGLETSSRNSGVLHSGLHQNPKFLKSKLAQEGNGLAAQYMKEKGLPILDSGMIVAVSWEAIKEGLWRELGAFFGLLRRGFEQKISFKFLLPWQLRKLEPKLRAIFGIFISDVWIIDPKQFVAALQKDAGEEGVEFLFNSPVQRIEKTSSSFILHTNEKEITTNTVINAAGLYADDIARMAGFDQYKIYPWRGEYYEIVGLEKNLVRRLIYPAMPHNSPSKGIHFSPRVDGRLYIGPNARAVPHKNYYTEDKTPVEEFLAAAQRFIPEVKKENLKWAYSGIRPKTTNTSEETDFIIKVDSYSPPFVNLIGIESPGLAASMGIAKYVAEVLGFRPW